MLSMRKTTESTYVYRECSGYVETFDATDELAAVKQARQWLREGEWVHDRDEVGNAVPTWVSADVTDSDGVLIEEIIMLLVVPEPTGCEHQWHQWSVIGHDGGVEIVDHCRDCCTDRVTDTWATIPASGQVWPEPVVYYRRNSNRIPERQDVMSTETTVITEEQAREWLREVIVEFGPDHRAPKTHNPADAELADPGLADDGCVYTWMQDDGTITACCIVGVIAHRKLGIDLEELRAYDTATTISALALLGEKGFTGTGVLTLQIAQVIQDGGTYAGDVDQHLFDEMVSDPDLQPTMGSGRPWVAVAKVLHIDLPASEGED